MHWFFSPWSGARYFNSEELEVVRSIRPHENEAVNLNNIACVTITFMKQKNITMHKSNNELCPVKAWGPIVKRI